MIINKIKDIVKTIDREEILKGLSKGARIKYIGPNITVPNANNKAIGDVIVTTGTYGYKVRNCRAYDDRYKMMVILNSKQYKIECYRLTCERIEVTEKLLK